MSLGSTYALSGKIILHSKITMSLDTLVNPTTVGTDIAGPMADFDPNQAYSWPAVRWAGTYSGPTDVAMLDAATSFDTSVVSAN
jgi:hypothetical protein